VWAGRFKALLGIEKEKCLFDESKTVNLKRSLKVTQQVRSITFEGGEKPSLINCNTYSKNQFSCPI